MLCRTGDGTNNPVLFQREENKTLQISFCDCRCDRMKVFWPKLDAVLQQTLKTDYSLLIQIKPPYTYIQTGFCENMFVFWFSPFISLCIIHLLYVLHCVLSEYLLGAIHSDVGLGIERIYFISCKTNRVLPKDLYDSRHLSLDLLNEKGHS